MVETSRGGSLSDPTKNFFETLRSSVLLSFPALSALVFVVVAVKVFRASLMESTTTVAIVSNANAVALLKGVILTLLPGFLAALTAISIWWWGGVVPRKVLRDPAKRKEAVGRALFSPEAVFAWALAVMAFFTIWWPIFVALLVPVLATTSTLVVQYFQGSAHRPTSPAQKRALAVAGDVILVLAIALMGHLGVSWPAVLVIVVPVVAVVAPIIAGPPQVGAGLPLARTLRTFGLVAAAVFIGILTLQPSVWLPLRTISVKGSEPLMLNGKPLRLKFGAYVLSRDKDSVSLLLESPRAVVQVEPGRLESATPLCVPPATKWRVLSLRASQLVRVDRDPGTPYEICPNMRRKTL